MKMNDVVVNWVERVTIIGVPGDTEEEILENLSNHTFFDMICSEDIGLLEDNPELEISETYYEDED
jgi:hypothetical protein